MTTAKEAILEYRVNLGVAASHDLEARGEKLGSWEIYESEQPYIDSLHQK